MKVFIRSAALQSQKPEVIAYYDDDTDVPDTAHGPGVTVLYVPANALFQEKVTGNPAQLEPMPRLVPNWRDMASNTILTGEANRRIKEVLPSGDGANLLHELITLVLRYGANVAEWPSDAQARKAEIDTTFNYVRAVRERAKSFGGTPADPASDKAWPTRIKR